MSELYEVHDEEETLVDDFRENEAVNQEEASRIFASEYPDW